MTTVREVRRWTKGILAEHDDLVLNARELCVEPVQHIYRAISFIGSSERAFSKPTVVFGALFVAADAIVRWLYRLRAEGGTLTLTRGWGG